MSDATAPVGTNALCAERLSASPTAAEIAAEAYAIYMARGGQEGHHDEDWLEAESRLRRDRGR
jgi:hypothetical protein